jgi:hypothetical protein
MRSMLTYAGVCAVDAREQQYADVCWRMLAYALRTCRCARGGVACCSSVAALYSSVAALLQLCCSSVAASKLSAPVDAREEVWPVAAL